MQKPGRGSDQPPQGNLRKNPISALAARAGKDLSCCRVTCPGTLGLGGASSRDIPHGTVVMNIGGSEQCRCCCCPHRAHSGQWLPTPASGSRGGPQPDGTVPLGEIWGLAFWVTEEIATPLFAIIHRMGLGKLLHPPPVSLLELETEGAQ